MEELVFSMHTVLGVSPSNRPPPPCTVFVCDGITIDIFIFGNKYCLNSQVKI